MILEFPKKRIEPGDDHQGCRVRGREHGAEKSKEDDERPDEERDDEGLHGSQIAPEDLHNRRQEERKAWRVHSRADRRIMRIVDVACLRVRKSIREVLGVMDVHAEVVTPIMPFPERDEVEDADEDGAEKSDE